MLDNAHWTPKYFGSDAHWNSGDIMLLALKYMWSNGIMLYTLQEFFPYISAYAIVYLCVAMVIYIAIQF